jgi:hypothetical protein
LDHWYDLWLNRLYKFEVWKVLVQKPWCSLTVYPPGKQVSLNSQGYHWPNAAKLSRLLTVTRYLLLLSGE